MNVNDLKDRFDVTCPRCGKKKYIGFLGGSSCRRYFCNECCTEFAIKGNKLKIYSFNSSGLIEEEKEP